MSGEATLKYGMRDALRATLGFLLILNDPARTPRAVYDRWRDITGDESVTAVALAEHIERCLSVGAVGDAEEAFRLWALKPGHVLTQQDVDDIQAILHELDEAEGSNVEAHNNGREQILFEIGGDQLVQMARRTDCTARIAQQAIAHYRMKQFLSEAGECVGVDAAAKVLCEWIGYAWESIRDERTRKDEFPEWHHGSVGGRQYQGDKEDLRAMATKIAALATARYPYLVWWTTREDAGRVGVLQPMLPHYVCRQLELRMERKPLAGRLLIDEELQDAPREVIFRHDVPASQLAQNMAGIVIRGEDAGRVSALPGMVTTFELRLPRW
jgi:hypothetical protein